ncbi:MAG: ribonuclease P protein component [Candidatus Magasanikbacteria bacterium]
MLPRENRLKHMKDFEVLSREGKFFSDALVTSKVVRIAPNLFPRRDYTEENLLFGFVVSKKIEKSAVRRNKAKRQIREAVRLLLKEKKCKHGYVVVIMAKKEIFGKEFTEIQKSVENLLHKIGIV